MRETIHTYLAMTYTGPARHNVAFPRQRLFPFVLYAFRVNWCAVAVWPLRGHPMGRLLTPLGIEANDILQ